MEERVLGSIATPEEKDGEMAQMWDRMTMGDSLDSSHDPWGNRSLQEEPLDLESAQEFSLEHQTAQDPSPAGSSWAGSLSLRDESAKYQVIT